MSGVSLLFFLSSLCMILLDLSIVLQYLYQPTNRKVRDQTKTKATGPTLLFWKLCHKRTFLAAEGAAMMIRLETALPLNQKGTPSSKLGNQMKQRTLPRLYPAPIAPARTAKLRRRPRQKFTPTMVLLIEWATILQNSRVLVSPLNHYDPSAPNQRSIVNQVSTSPRRTRKAPTELIPTRATVATYFPSLEVRIETTTTARPLANHRKSPAMSASVLVAARAIHSGNLPTILLQMNALGVLILIGIPNQISTAQGDQMDQMVAVTIVARRCLFVSRIVE